VNQRSILFWLVVVLLPFLHFLLQVGFQVGNWTPDLLTLSLLLASREMRMSRAAGLGFLLGVLEDAFSILAFGANTLTLTLLGIVGARTRDLFLGESVQFFLIYLALGTWSRFALHWMVAGEEVRGVPGRVLLLEAPLTALFTAALGLFILFATGSMRRLPG
jgi:rod shape-determining protein MreD